MVRDIGSSRRSLQVFVDKIHPDMFPWTVFCIRRRAVFSWHSLVGEVALLCRLTKACGRDTHGNDLCHGVPHRSELKIFDGVYCTIRREESHRMVLGHVLVTCTGRTSGHRHLQYHPGIVLKSSYRRKIPETSPGEPNIPRSRRLYGQPSVQPPVVQHLDLPIRRDPSHTQSHDPRI